MKLNFSSNFRRLRLERQLTQEQIAEMLGVSDKSDDQKIEHNVKTLSAEVAESVLILS